MSAEYNIELICLMLAVPVVKCRTGNRDFVGANWWWFSGIVIAGFMCLVGWILFYSLLFAANELLGVYWYYSRGAAYFNVFIFSVGFAMLLLSFLTRHEGRMPEKTGVLSAMLYYILTPVILAYNLLLYIYLGFSAVQWELPAGYVAVMVFALTLSAFLIKALRELLPHKRYGWYYDNLSYISIPALLLFWVGTGYRICEYGFTEARVYLVICGIIMTVSLAAFARKGRGNYRRCWILAIALLGIFTFVTPINAERIGIHSQTRRLVKLAKELDLLENDRRLKEVYTLPDENMETVLKFIELQEAYRYVFYNSGNDWGVHNPYTFGQGLIDPALDPNTDTSGHIFADHPSSVFDTRDIRCIVYAGHEWSNSDYIYLWSNDHLIICWNGKGEQVLDPITTDIPVEVDKYLPVWIGTVDTIFDDMLSRAGLSSREIIENETDLTPEQEYALTTYEDGPLRLFFDGVYLYPLRTKKIQYDHYRLMVLVKQ